MIVLNQSLAQARLWLANNPPARVEKVDQSSGRTYTTVAPREWIRQGGAALAAYNLVLRAREGSLVVFGNGPALVQSFRLSHLYSPDVDEWSRTQAVDEDKPLGLAVAQAETRGLAAAIKALLWDVSDDVPEPLERPRKPVEESRTQAQIREDERRAKNGAHLPDRSERGVTASVVLKDHNPPGWKPHKGAPHTVPKDASMEEHLGLAVGDGLPATSARASGYGDCRECGEPMSDGSGRAEFHHHRCCRRCYNAAGVVHKCDGCDGSAGYEAVRRRAREERQRDEAQARADAAFSHGVEPDPADVRAATTHAGKDEGTTSAPSSPEPQGVPVVGAEGGKTSAPVPSTDVATMPIAEVDAELARLGIDLAPGLAKVLAAVAAKRAGDSTGDTAPPSSPLAVSPALAGPEVQPSSGPAQGSSPARCESWCSYECCGGLSMIATRCGRPSGHEGRHACPTTLDRDPRHSERAEGTSPPPDDVDDVDGGERCAECDAPLVECAWLATGDLGCAECGPLSHQPADAAPLVEPTPEAVALVGSVASRTMSGMEEQSAARKRTRARASIARCDVVRLRPAQSAR